MKYMLKYSTILLLLLLAFSSCRKEPNFPDEPKIEFRRVEQFHFERNRLKTDSLVLVIHYEDGDGNLGLLPDTASTDWQPPFDRGSPYHKNFITKLYIRVPDDQKPGQFRFVEYQFPVAGFDYSGRFQRLSADERSEPLEGEIKYSFKVESDLFRPGDVIKFDIFIYDRNRPVPNKSNVITTDEITLFQE